MSWLSRLKTKQASEALPTETTKTVSVVFVGSPGDQIGKIEKFDDLNAAANGPIPDPDRWCWPNSPAMNGREIGIFSIRLEHLRSLGVDLDTAEKLADRLVIRDRELDDRIVCFECCHLRNGWRCMNWRNAGAWVHHSNSKLQSDFVHQLQRCPGFKSAIGEVNEQS
jgi:hypothetical protein